MFLVDRNTLAQSWNAGDAVRDRLFLSSCHSEVDINSVVRKLCNSDISFAQVWTSRPWGEESVGWRLGSQRGWNP